MKLSALQPVPVAEGIQVGVELRHVLARGHAGSEGAPRGDRAIEQHDRLATDREELLAPAHDLANGGQLGIGRALVRPRRLPARRSTRWPRPGDTVSLAAASWAAACWAVWVSLTSVAPTLPSAVLSACWSAVTLAWTCWRAWVFLVLVAATLPSAELTA